MSLHSNMPTDEFIAYLRERAIANNAPSIVVDKIDQLTDFEALESEIEELGGQVSDLERDKEDLIEELESLCKAIDENLEPDNQIIEGALKIALSAVERHKDA